VAQVKIVTIPGNLGFANYRFKTVIKQFGSTKKLVTCQNKEKVNSLTTSKKGLFSEPNSCYYWLPCYRTTPL
jgi:hypothetical protein